MIFHLKQATNFLAIYTALSLSVFFLSFQFVFAHGDGASFEKEIGNYSVDIGYNPAQPETGLSERLDFKLSEKTSGSTVPFSDVWVRIEKEKNTVFAAGIHNPEFGKAGLLYSFPEAGTYTIFARFEKDDKTIVETSFNLDVADSSKETKTSPFSRPIVWGIVGIVAGLLLSKIRKRN